MEQELSFQKGLKKNTKTKTKTKNEKDPTCAYFRKSEDARISNMTISPRCQ